MNRQGWYESLVKPACTIEVHDKPFGDEIRLFLKNTNQLLSIKIITVPVIVSIL